MRYVYELGNMWKKSGWGWRNWNLDKSYLKDMFFYLGFKKNSHTHVHIQWSYRDRIFNVIYKCNNDHIRIEPLNTSNDQTLYIQDFANFLQNCSGSQTRRSRFRGGKSKKKKNPRKRKIKTKKKKRQRRKKKKI